MAEVISMEEFKKDDPEHCEECDNLQKDWDWAQERSVDLIRDAGSSVRILMLIRNLVDDTMQAVDQLCGDEMPVDQFYEAVTDGVAMYREVSE